MHTALVAVTSFEANDSVATSRKNHPLEVWRRLQKRYDPTTGRKETKPSAHDHFSWTVTWSHVSRHEKKLKNKVDDEIKLAGLEALLPGGA